jgi:hypothetical protein
MLVATIGRFDAITFGGHYLNLYFNKADWNRNAQRQKAELSHPL